MTAILLALALICTATTAAADPATIIVGYLSQAGITVGMWGLAAIRLGVALAGSALMSLVNRKKDTKRQGQAYTTYGANTPLSFPVGECVVGGFSNVAPYISGSKKNIRTYVFVLSNMPISGLTKFWINGKGFSVDTDMTGPVDPIYGRGVNPETRPDYEGKVWFNFYDGTQTTADPGMVELFSDHATRPWTDKMKGKGSAVIYLHIKIDNEITFDQNEVLFQVEGVKFYDPRKDSTRGGDGPHRFGDMSTYEPSRNGIVQAYNMFSGALSLPNGQQVGGRVALADLPLSWWVPAMNEIDARGWECGFEYELETLTEGGDSYFKFIEICETACNARFAEVAGSWIVKVGVGAPTLYMDDGDGLQDQMDTLHPFPSITERFNSIQATYVQRKKGWAMAAGKVFSNDEAVARDGRERIAQVEFIGVNRTRQGNSIARSMLADHLRTTTVERVLHRGYSGMHPLLDFEWDSAYFGFENEQFDIDTVVLHGASLSVTVTAKARSTLDELFDEETPESEYDGDFDLPNATPPVLDVTSYVNAAGRCVIKIVWDQESRLHSRIVLRVRKQGDTDGEPLRIVVDADEGGYELVGQGIRRSTWYEVSAAGRRPRTGFSNPVTVRTADGGGVDEEDLSVDLSTFINGTREQAEQAVARGEEAYTLAEAAQMFARAQIAELQAFTDDFHMRILGRAMQLATDASSSAVQQTRFQIEFDNTSATFSNQIVTLADGQLALVQDLTQLTAVVGDNGSQIEQIGIAYVDADAALADLIATLRTEYEGAMASASSQLSALSSSQLATASQVTALSTTVNGHTSSINANAQAISTAVSTQASSSQNLQSQINGVSSQITTINQTLTNINGFTSAYSGVSVQSGAHGAYLTLSSYQNPDGSGGSAILLDAEMSVLKGTVYADHLVFGLNGNLLSNADMRQKDRNYAYSESGGVASQSTYSFIPATENYAGKNHGAVQIYQSGTATDGWSVVRNIDYTEAGAQDWRPFDVKPQERLEVSVQALLFNCTGTIEVHWYDSNGDYMYNVNVGTFAKNQLGAADVADAPRYGGFVTVPANAKYAGFGIRKYGTSSGTASRATFFKPQMKKVEANATELSPWGPGGVGQIHQGSIYFTGITADLMTVTDLSAISANLGTIQVGTLNIAGNAVTIPKTQKRSTAISGNDDWQEMHNTTITLDQPGEVVIWWVGQQYYSAAGTPGWGMRLWINGTKEFNRLTDNGNSGIRQDITAFIASESLPAGTHTIKADWFGQTSGVNMGQRTLVIQAAKR